MFLPELQSKFSKLDSLISRYEYLSKTRKFRDSTISFCSQNINNTVESIQIELGALREPSEKKKFQEFLNARNERIRNINESWQKSTNPHAREHAPVCMGQRSYNDDIASLNDSSLSDYGKGDALIQLADESVLRMKKSLMETERIGDESLNKMNAQKEQLSRIRGELDNVNINIDKAGISLKAIARNTATDFCVQMLCGVFSICVLIIVILLIILGVRKNNPAK
ncbi:putative t-snare domain and transmembrane domain-containing protein [Cryptosporidium canis]|uniref:T-snare domain and transmembrane domain-containing protein n=1 Tax=Cryptosporidium canis TaxID=195482 RepID=A0ABQ8P440_9CRYT|nr:putative t-snare domain and transmembrane domain-containing protein [Cryptosporidium canis]KAJ1607532.1 putative t-snare domain and transmembrane domain-containing protein [Cryptosporidium canis]